MKHRAIIFLFLHLIIVILVCAWSDELDGTFTLGTKIRQIHVLGT